ncbi:PA14 domain-containing protein [Litorilituus sediminis]|nr:PA14 domain-containing protein [Litorilituus sediminis]
MKFVGLKVVAATALIALSSFANASLLLVEQYDDFWSTDVNQLISYANNNNASSSAYWGEIDFTDDPRGFAGDIPGSNPWPSAANAGASGTGHALNQTFFARITGEFLTTVADNYFFRTFNDDGVFVYIDGELVINDPSLHAERRFEGSKSLAAGTHSIEVYFFENGGEASLELSVANSSRIFTHFNDVNSPVSLTAKIPEPTTLAIFSLGLLGLAARTRKSK